MPMRILTAKFAPQEPHRGIITAKFGKNSHEIVRLRAQQANSQEHQNTESQNTESQERQDNQTAEVNRHLEARHRADTEDKQRLQAQIAQRQSQNQCDNTRTEMTLRPCWGLSGWAGRATVSRARGDSTQDGRAPTGATATTKRRRRIKGGPSRSKENKLTKLFTKSQTRPTISNEHPPKRVYQDAGRRDRAKRRCGE